MSSRESQSGRAVLPSLPMKNRDRHHCPGDDGWVGSRSAGIPPGGCRWPPDAHVKHCATHMNYCIPHYQKFMKGKQCLGCEEENIRISREKNEQQNRQNEALRSPREKRKRDESNMNTHRTETDRNLRSPKKYRPKSDYDGAITRAASMQAVLGTPSKIKPERARMSIKKVRQGVNCYFALADWKRLCRDILKTDISRFEALVTVKGPQDELRRLIEEFRTIA